MLVTIDNLASRYHLLPSECLLRADTFDIEVLHVSARWEQHQREAINRQSQGLGPAPKSPKLTQEQMLGMIKTVKERHG